MDYQCCDQSKRVYEGQTEITVSPANHRRPSVKFTGDGKTEFNLTLDGVIWVRRRKWKTEVIWSNLCRPNSKSRPPVKTSRRNA